jgi:hypothetical protein
MTFQCSTILHPFPYPDIPKHASGVFESLERVSPDKQKVAVYEHLVELGTPLLYRQELLPC